MARRMNIQFIKDIKLKKMMIKKHKIVTCALLIAISSILGSIGLMTSGCKTNEQIQVI